MAHVSRDLCLALLPTLHYAPLLLSSSWPTFAAVLAFTTFVSAQNLAFAWPKYPESHAESSLTCDGGTPPYTIYVFMPDLTKYYFKYEGSEPSATYHFPLVAGTEITFQCRDSDERVVTSPTITIIATLNLLYPHDLQTGVQTNIRWDAGLSPYTVSVLTADLTKYYWNYTGSRTSQEWTPDVPAGTQVRFQVVDSNGVRVTGDVVTVQANDNLSKRALSGSALSVHSTKSVASVESVKSIKSLNSTHSFTTNSSSVGSTLTVPPTTLASTTTSAHPSGTTAPSGGGKKGKKTRCYRSNVRIFWVLAPLLVDLQLLLLICK